MSKLLRTAVLVLAFGTAASVAQAGCSAAGDVSAIAQRMIAETNQFRRSLGLGQVKLSPALSKAAAAHACDMASTGSFGHVGRNGSNVKTRASKAGYGRACVIAENIAWGYKENVVMQGWETSAKHRANLTHRKVKEVGIGLAYNGTTPYWVMMLASKC